MKSNTNKNKHELLIEILEAVQNDMKIYRVKKRIFKKSNKKLKPELAYRTGDLLKYVYEKCNRDENRIQAAQLLEECFKNCTLTKYYYIHMSDLRVLIYNHQTNGKWS